MLGISGLNSLEALDLLGARISGVGIGNLAALTNLRRLYLTNTLVDDDAIAELATLPHLEKIDLYGTRVTFKGLVQFAKSPKLRRLIVARMQNQGFVPSLFSAGGEATGVTTDEMKRLQQALPRCKIDEFRDF